MGKKHKFKTFHANPSPDTPDRDVDVAALQTVPKDICTITMLKALLIITVVGMAFYWSGFSGQFLGDDIAQIVNNLPVHSISNIGQFFSHSTFYVDGRLTGSFYRPMMTTVFSLTYTIFGDNPLPFHLIQILVQILGAFVLFLVMRYFLRPVTSLVIALVFLVHPIDSQAVFSIAAMQDTLFFLFGILAFWALLRFYYESRWWLLLTAGLLLLSLLSKESGILFVIMALTYTFMHDRDWRIRFYPLLSLALIIGAAYLALRLSAIGLVVNQHIAPIDNLSMAARLMNAPAIIMFYLTKFVFPVSLAHAYYWVYPSFTIRHFLFPLLVDLVVVGLVIYAARLARLKAKDGRYSHLFAFFSVWLLAGMLMTLPFVPLDMTVCETWFLFPMVGMLGLIGVLYEVFGKRIPSRWLVVGIAVVVLALGVRTTIRGFNWSSDSTLVSHDVTVSKEDYVSDEQLALNLESKGQLTQARAYAQRSIDSYPTASGYKAYGEILGGLGSYAAARQAFNDSIRMGGSERLLDEDLGRLDLFSGFTGSSVTFLNMATLKFPNDANLWLYLAILENRDNNNGEARIAVTRAAELGGVNKTTYDLVYNNQPSSLKFTY